MKTYRYVYDIYMITIEQGTERMCSLGYDFYETTSSKFPMQWDILKHLKENYFKEYPSDYCTFGLEDHPKYASSYFKVCPLVLKIAPLKFVIVNNVRRI